MTAAIEAFAASDRTRRLVWCLGASTRVSDEHLLPCPQCGVTQQHGTSTMKQFTVLSIVLVLCTLIPSVLSADEPDGDPLYEAARQAWIARSQQARSFRVTWTQRQVLSDGLETPDRELNAAIAEVAGKVLHNRFVLSIVGEKARLTKESLADSVGPIGKGTSVFDGSITKTVGQFEGKNHQGTLTHQPFPSKHIPDYLAIFLHLRGADGPATPIPTCNSIRSEETVDASGRRMCKFVCGGVDPNATAFELWADPENQWAITQFNLSHGAEHRSQLTISYAANDVIGTVPDRWTFARYRGIQKVAEITGVFEKWEFNPSLNDADFELEFPPGTRYFDVTTGEVKDVESGS